MRNTSFLLSTSLLFAGACVPLARSAPPTRVNAVPPQAVRGVRAAVAAMEAAFAAGTPARVADHYTADAVLLAPGRQTAGRAAIALVWSTVPSGRQWRLELTEIGGGPEEPWSRGRSHLAWVDEVGVAHARTSEVLAVWRRQPDGRYQLHRDVMLPEPARPARP
jgi:ketosteroid isomerase-like protein